jgi:glycosyltransferase involved in cell wall biosynthesis
MDISVVIPTYNRREIVHRSLETLFTQTLSASRFEIIVVVDGSTDGTADSLRGLHPACRFRVIEQENRGPSGARNTGFRATAADLVLFLDDDMRCEPALLAAHVAAHSGPSLAVVFGAIFLSPDSPRSLAAECFQREIGAFYLEHKRNPKVEWQITDSVFLNTSLPRALLNDVGGFDEAFRMREDLELGIRLIASGARPIYASNAIAYQYYEKTPAKLIGDARGFAAADVQLARKHPEAVIVGQLNWLARQPRRRQLVHRAAAYAPFLADLILLPMSCLGEVFFRVQPIRNMAVHALQLRRRVHWYRRVIDLGWRPSEAKGT